MNETQKLDFVRRMGKRKGLAKGGVVRKGYTAGGAIAGAGGGAAMGATIGSVIPGVGTAAGAIVGGVAGFINGLFGGGGPEMPNIVDPVTGTQITDASGKVVATQQDLMRFSNSLQGANGIEVQKRVMGQLQDVSVGGGPNPAKAMLAESTGSNISNQAALMAGQRGASSNVGLMARQAGEEGAAIQQESVGQAATLQSQQQLNALGAAAGVAGQVVGEQQGALNSANAAATNNQSNLLTAQGQYNNAITSGQGNVNNNNASMTNATIQPMVDVGKGVIAGAGAQQVYNSTPTMPQSTGGRGSQQMTRFASGGRVVEGPHASHVANFLMMAEGGKVPAEVSPGEVYLTPDKVDQVLGGANPLEVGERIPGKAKVKGDSKKNDTVPRTLEEGGVVVPRSHSMNEEKAALFVHRAMAKKGRR